MPGVLGKDPKVPFAGRSKVAVPLVFGVEKPNGIPPIYMLLPVCGDVK